ncbi:MAG TPA: hypothetical protein VFL80_08370 [Thermoanaerobaculia bacterium]|nr:hypothetical protein [Thermoanaerobaculia bacterium]
MKINLFPDWSLLAILAIFILNYLVVRRFFLRPINEVLEVREQEVKSAEASYEAAMSRLNEATAEMETRLHAARKEASTVRDRFRAEAAAHRATVLQRTQAEAKTAVTEATSKLDRDVAVAREAIVRDAEALARSAAEQILGRRV